MEWKDFLNRNWSRKAEIVGLGLVDVYLIAKIDGIDKTVQMAALVIVGVITLAGLVIQGILDWKHPKIPPGVTKSKWVNGIGISEINDTGESKPPTAEEPLLKRPVRVSPFDTQHPPTNMSPKAQA